MENVKYAFSKVEEIKGCKLVSRHISYHNSALDLTYNGKEYRSLTSFNFRKILLVDSVYPLNERLIRIREGEYIMYSTKGRGFKVIGKVFESDLLEGYKIEIV